jgi:hypothetical protein
VLVIDGSTGEFESGLGAGGQTAEHAVLVRRCGAWVRHAGACLEMALVWSAQSGEVGSACWGLLAPDACLERQAR